jgi:hypothetical protein
LSKERVTVKGELGFQSAKSKKSQALEDDNKGRVVVRERVVAKGQSGCSSLKDRVTAKGELGCHLFL